MNKHYLPRWGGFYLLVVIYFVACLFLGSRVVSRKNWLWNKNFFFAIIRIPQLVFGELLKMYRDVIRTKNECKANNVKHSKDKSFVFGKSTCRQIIKVMSIQSQQMQLHNSLDKKKSFNWKWIVSFRFWIHFKNGFVFIEQYWELLFDI